MTLAEIIAEFKKGSTPELVAELSRLCREAQGKCMHKNGVRKEWGLFVDKLICVDCGWISKLKNYPSILDPAAWGPMLEKLRKEYWVEMVGSYFAIYEFNSGQGKMPSPFFECRGMSTGVAIGLAMLSIIKDKSNG